MGILKLEPSLKWEKEFDLSGASASLLWPPDCGYNEDRIVELTHVHVDPRFRGRGIASSLVDLIKKYARRQKLKLFIRVCPYGDGSKLNKRQLRKFYTNRGFIRYTKDPDWYIWDDIS